MGNKKLGVLIILTIILSLLTVTLVTARSDFSATLISQSPDPVEPGQVVKIKFEIENAGDETTEDITATLHYNYPFELYGEEATRNLGKVRSTTSGADTIIVEYNLKVDDLANEGLHEINLQIEEGAGSLLFEDIYLDIQTHDAILEISSVEISPAYISPGENAQVTVMIKNLADSLLKDIIFALDFTDDDLPLAPYQSSSERRVANIETDFQRSLTFNIIAEPDATQGLYKVPLTITYNDEKGNAYNTTDVLALQIGKVPSLQTHIKKTTIHKAKTPGTITIEVANSGVSDVKYVEIELIEAEEYQLLSPTNYFYIGDIDSDDTESEEISLYVSKKVDEVRIPLRLTYSDGNNQAYEKVISLSLPLYSNRQLKKFGLAEEKGSLFTYLIILLALGGGAYYYRKRKKSKK